MLTKIIVVIRVSNCWIMFLTINCSLKITACLPYKNNRPYDLLITVFGMFDSLFRCIVL